MEADWQSPGGSAAGWKARVQVVRPVPREQEAEPAPARRLARAEAAGLPHVPVRQGAAAARALYL
jgi:hypothetical protein